MLFKLLPCKLDLKVYRTTSAVKCSILLGPNEIQGPNERGRHRTMRYGIADIDEADDSEPTTL